MSDQDVPLPPATFEYLVFSLKMQADMQLGAFHFGDEKDRPTPDLRIARHTIDLLAALQEKTKGNLAMEEQRFLENSLTELRFRYVQAVEQSHKRQPEVTPVPEAAAPAEPAPASESTPAPEPEANG